MDNGRTPEASHLGFATYLGLEFGGSVFALPDRWRCPLAPEKRGCVHHDNHR